LTCVKISTPVEQKQINT